MSFKIFIPSYILFQLIDTITTVYGTSHGLVEANPIMKQLLTGSIIDFILIKFTITMLIIYMVYHINKKHPIVGCISMLLLTTFIFATVLNNTLQII